MKTLADLLNPTEEEHQAREHAINIIKERIEGHWEMTKVHSFGSQKTKLYLFDS